jgi:hypothetical protein
MPTSGCRVPDAVAVDLALIKLPEGSDVPQLVDA